MMAKAKSGKRLSKTMHWQIAKSDNLEAKSIQKL